MPTALEDGGAPAVGLTPVDIREALRGDGVGRVLVDVLQAQAGQLRLVEETGLWGRHVNPGPPTPI